MRSDLAYGMMGDFTCGIMENENLTIDVEILAIADAADLSGVMSDDQKLQKMEEVKERAT